MLPDTVLPPAPPTVQQASVAPQPTLYVTYRGVMVIYALDESRAIDLGAKRLAKATAMASLQIISAPALTWPTESEDHNGIYEISFRGVFTFTETDVETAAEKASVALTIARMGEGQLAVSPPTEYGCPTCL